MKRNLTALGVLAGAALTMLFAGCESTFMYNVTQPDLEEVTDFLPEHQLLVKQDSKCPFQYLYLNTKGKKYENLYIAPVNTSYLRKSKNWAELDKKLAGKLGDDIDSIAKFMRERYVAEAKLVQGPDRPRVVDTPNGKNTLIMETAIIAIVPNKAELNVLGIAGNFLLPGISILVQRMAAGSIAIECVVRDSETKEVQAMYASVLADQAAVLSLKALSWYGSAQRNIEKAAKYTATLLVTRDYGSVKRDTPYKLITW